MCSMTRKCLDFGVTLIRVLIWGAKLKCADLRLVRKDSDSGGGCEGWWVEGKGILSLGARAWNAV